MLQLKHDKLNRGVALAKAYCEYMAQKFPPSHEPQDIMAGLEEAIEKGEGCSDSIQFQEFEYFLNGLSDRELKEFQTLMYLGRGDFLPEEFEETLTSMHWDEDRNHEVNQIMAIPSSSST